MDVKVTRLDELGKVLSIVPPVLLKLDVQGQDGTMGSNGLRPYPRKLCEKQRREKLYLLRY